MSVELPLKKDINLVKAFLKITRILIWNIVISIPRKLWILVKAFLDPIIGATILIGLPLAQVIHIRYLRLKDVDPESPELQLLIEAHGLIYDIVFFGVLMVAVNNLIEQRRRIERYKDEIEDFRRWDEKEAVLRNVGNIKRLNKEGISRIELYHCYLKGADLSYINLQGADLKGANLQRANMGKANLKGADLV